MDSYESLIKFLGEEFPPPRFVSLKYTDNGMAVLTCDYGTIAMNADEFDKLVDERMDKEGWMLDPRTGIER